MTHLHPQRQGALGLSTINGLPAHILLVHAVVVLVPLSALALVAAIKPSIARRLGVALPALAAAAFVSVLAAMNAGGWLENHVHDTTLVRDHTRIAGQLWPFSAAVLVLSAVVWWLQRRTSGVAEPSGVNGGRALTIVVVGVLSLVMAAASVVEVVRIGESGSRAAWHNPFSQTATTHPQ
jgi:hypothetical protein